MSTVVSTFMLTDRDQKGVPKSMTDAWPNAAPGLAVSTRRPMPVAIWEERTQCVDYSCTIRDAGTY